MRLDHHSCSLPVTLGGGDDAAGGYALIDGESARIAHGGADADLWVTGAAERVGFHRAAGLRREQGFECLLRGGAFG